MHVRTLQTATLWTVNLSTTRTNMRRNYTSFSRLQTFITDHCLIHEPILGPFSCHNTNSSGEAVSQRPSNLQMPNHWRHDQECPLEVHIRAKRDGGEPLASLATKPSAALLEQGRFSVHNRPIIYPQLHSPCRLSSASTAYTCRRIDNMPDHFLRDTASTTRRRKRDFRRTFSSPKAHRRMNRDR